LCETKRSEKKKFGRITSREQRRPCRPAG